MRAFVGKLSADDISKVMAWLRTLLAVIRAFVPQTGHPRLFVLGTGQLVPFGFSEQMAGSGFKRAC